MIKTILGFLLALAMPLLATPQTSLADLKAAQNPPTIVNMGGPVSDSGYGLNYNGAGIALQGDISFAGTLGPFSGAGWVDFTNVSGAARGNASVNCDGSMTLIDLSNLLNYLDAAQIGSVSFQGCGLTTIDNFITAANAAPNGASINVSGNTVTGGSAAGIAPASTTGSTTYTIQNCGLTNCPGITLPSGLPGCSVDVSGNLFTTVNLAGNGAMYLNGSLYLGNSLLTTVSAGDGIYTGIVATANSYNALSFAGSALPEANTGDNAVCDLLTALAAMNTATSNNFTLDLSGGTNAAYSTWSATSQALYTSLVGSGCTITTN